MMISLDTVKPDADFLSLLTMTDEQCNQALKLIYRRIAILETQNQKLQDEKEILKLKLKRRQDGQRQRNCHCDQ